MEITPQEFAAIAIGTTVFGTGANWLSRYFPLPYVGKETLDETPRKSRKVDGVISFGLYVFPYAAMTVITLLNNIPE